MSKQKKELERVVECLRKDASTFRDQANRLDRYVCGLVFYAESLTEEDLVTILEKLRKLLPEHFSN